MQIAVINLKDSSCAYVYQGSAPNQQQFGGPWGWSDWTIHVQIPSALISSLPSTDLDSNGQVLPMAVKGQLSGGIWSVIAA